MDTAVIKENAASLARNFLHWWNCPVNQVLSCWLPTVGGKVYLKQFLSEGEKC